jgi:hypothetical protein
MPAWQKKILTDLLEELKPKIIAAVEAAKVKLRTSLGPDTLGKINAAGLELDKLAKDGWGPMSPEMTKALTTVADLLATVGVYTRPTAPVAPKAV